MSIVWSTNTAYTASSILYNYSATSTTASTLYTTGTYSSANYHNVFGNSRRRSNGNYPTIQKDDREDDGI